MFGKHRWTDVMTNLAVILCLGFAPAISRADAQSDAAQVLEQSGISAGFFVHLGAGDGQLSLALHKNEATQVHGLVRDASQLSAASTRPMASGDAHA